MAIEFKLPGLGENISSGDVVNVLVKEGDVLKANQDVVEIEAGKGTFPIACPHAGKVAKVFVSAGQSLNVGGPILSIETNQAAPAQGAAKPTPAATPTSPPTTAANPTAAVPTQQVAPVVSPPSRPAAEVPASTPAGPAAAAPAGPAMRRFARELGIDIHQVRGSGEGGRIVREDIVASVRQAASTTTAPSTASATRPGAPVEGEQGQDAWGPTRVQPLSRIRKTIAVNMHLSSSTIPHVTNFDDADVTELERIRKENHASVEVKLTMMAFVMKAVAQSLKLHPYLNASLDLEEGRIVFKDYVNLGVAVDTDRGLVVPVVRDVDRLTIAQIAQALQTLVAKARDNKFTLDELRGGTFTISNLGAIGGTYSTPIINPPEVAILLVGRSRQMPVVVDQQVTPRLMMPLSLSYDHRLVDGAVAARYLNEVKNFLEVPGRLLFGF